MRGEADAAGGTGDQNPSSGEVDVHVVGIAETGNLTAAARQHSVAPSTVTLALQQLEAQAVTRLITRSTRRLTFTREGELFLACAKRLLADWDGAIEGMRQHGPLKGTIRMTATNDFGRQQLVPLIDRFMAVHPAIRVSLHLGDGVVDLIENNPDLALRSGPLADSTLRARPLRRSQRVSAPHPVSGERMTNPRIPTSWRRHNCLILDRPGVPFSSWPITIDGKAAAVRVSGDRVANDGGVLRQSTVQRYGVMIKNGWEVRRELGDGTLETALEDFASPAVDFYAVTAGGEPSHRVAVLIDFLAEAQRPDLPQAARGPVDQALR